MLTSFLGKFPFRSSIKLSCAISAHYLHIAILTLGPSHYWQCSSSKPFHQKPHCFPTTSWAPAFIRGLALNLLFSLISTSSVCQTSSPLLVPAPSPCLDPKMSATLSPASLIHSAWNCGLIDPLASLTLWSAVQTEINQVQLCCSRTILLWPLYTLMRALPHWGFRVA